jgi:hypothetical protein
MILFDDQPANDHSTKCELCFGSGRIPDIYSMFQHRYCPICNGSGRVRRASTKGLPPIDERQLITESRRRLLARLDEGTICECCGQRAQRYRRKLSSSMVRALAFVYRRNGQTYFDLEAELRAMVEASPDLPRVGDAATLRHWDLLARDDEGYRVTPKGARFMLNLIRVPRYVFLYNNERHGFSNDSTSASDALGDRFSLDDLLCPRGEQYDSSARVAS